MTTMKENEPQKRLDGMLETVSGLESILILVHNNPDPDAIASAVALKFLLAEQLGIESHIAHGGIIGRAENKALVRCLGFPLRQLSDLNLDKPLPVAYVDTQPDTGHHAAPAASVVTIVIDHHPLREATGAAKYVDVREDVGAVSTILTEYLQAAGLEPTPLLATALFYGIKTDTRGSGTEQRWTGRCSGIRLPPVSTRYRDSGRDRIRSSLG